MPVISIKEDWERRTMEETLDERTAIRVFTVKFDEGDNPVIRLILTLLASTPTLSVPQKGDHYPGDDFLRVVKRTVKTYQGPFVYEVTCNYLHRWGGGDEEAEDPLIKKPEISWLSAVTNEPIDRDIEGNAVMNSAGEAFDPPITKEFNDLVLRYVRNERNFNQRRASEYKGAISSDSFLGFAEGTVMCTVFDGQKIYDEKRGDYYQVTYEFQIRFDGWKRKIFDKGFGEYLGKNEDGSPDWREILDKDGHKISEPAYLNGSGKKLPGETNLVHYLKNAVKLEFDLYRKKPFSALKIRI